MTSRWDDGYLEGHKAGIVEGAWILIATAIVAGIIGYSIGGGWGEPPAPVVVEKVDTVHSPPTPDFIEAFRLQCYWVPREENVDDTTSASES